jgi:signal transduction histidine kinase/ligand-binding sensor domain-containing protein
MCRLRAMKAASWLAVAAACLLSGPHDALALNPTFEINQYGHTTWRIRDGFFRGAIRSIAQTPDGYLWLATEFGVLRFDGIRAVTWEPPKQHLPSSDIWSVLASRDGGLWIGTAKGLARWKDGTLTEYPELSKYFVESLFEDRAGTVWASGVGIPVGTVCAIRDREVACDSQNGAFGYGAWGFYEDRAGSLWLGVNRGAWKWRPEPRLFVQVPGAEEDIHGFGEDGNGALLFATRRGIRRVVGQTTEPYLIPMARQPVRTYCLLRDGGGSLWIGTTAEGLAHVHEGKTDQFGTADGLSGQSVAVLFEDREGSVWVATENGLDRFRDVAVHRLSVKQGLPGPAHAVSAAGDGGMWISNSDGAAKWLDGHVVAYRARATQPGGANAREIVVNEMPFGAVGALFHDNLQRTWLAASTGFGYLRGDTFVRVRDVAARQVRAIVQDTQGSVWLSDQQLGLFRIAADERVDRFPWSTLGHNDFASAIVPDPVRGGLWLGFFNGGVAYVVDGKVRTAYDPADGLTGGWVKGLQIGPEDTLWVAAEGGLSRLDKWTVTTLSRRNGLPCDAVNWAIQDDSGSLWLNMPCGLVRIAAEDVLAWVNGRTHSITPTVFDAADGVRSESTPSGSNPHVAKATDGRLWFVGQDGANVIDPRHLPLNALPPPVHVQQVIADHRPYDLTPKREAPIRLPALTRDVQIDYTALSLVAPETNRFRVKLEGWDGDWQDVGNRRQVFYNNLPPRSYRFRVVASNNSGVWNESGAALEFSVAPAYYQTRWFQAATVAAALGLAAALYQLRLRQLASHFNIRLEERVNERTRLARDLHDTLLQSFQGLVLRFQAVAFLLPHGSDEARRTLESALDDAGRAIVEARDAVQGLRSATTGSSDLPSLITTLGEELTASQPDKDAPALSVNVEGHPREITPIVRDEIYRIAREALRNAFRHADASRIQVEIRYAAQTLRLRIRDDGKGIDQEVIDLGSRAGHFGLAGMRERAELMKGTLAIWSEGGSGTEVELTIPSSVAYAKDRTATPPSSLHV